MKKRHLAKKAVAVTMAALMAAGALTACSSGSGETEAAADSGDTADEGAADSGSTASKNGSFRRRVQYPCRNRWKPAKPHNTEHSGLPDEGRPLFLCPNMEVLF